MLVIGLLLLQTSVAEIVRDVSALAREAETQASTIADATDRANALFAISAVYERAGLVENLARLVKAPQAPAGLRARLAMAQAVYGDPAAALRTAETMSMPAADAVGYWNTLANILWRAGKPDHANAALRKGEALAKTIQDPALRRRHLEQAMLLRGNLQKAPPMPIELPWQKQGSFGNPVPNDFPITVVGFGRPDAELTARRQAANAEYLASLYDYVAKGNVQGAFGSLSAAPDPFARTLGLATLQHLYSQVNKLESAAACVAQMGESDDDTILAKAEASVALAVKLREANQVDEAGAALASAFTLAKKAKGPWGKTIVLAEMGAKASELGYTATSRDYFAEAIAVAGGVPHDMQRITKGIYQSDARFRGELFEQILSRLIRASDYGAAQALAARWRKEAGPSYSGSIGGIWLRAGRSNDALVFARQLPTAKERCELLCAIATDRLDKAGAPYL